MGNMKHQHREHYNTQLPLEAEYARLLRRKKVIEIAIQSTALVVVGVLLILILSIGSGGAA
jgi:hypothetical protein